MGPPTDSQTRTSRPSKLGKAGKIHAVHPKWSEFVEPAPEPSSGMSTEPPAMDIRTASVLKNAAAAVERAKQFREQSRERRSSSNAPSDLRQPINYQSKTSVHPRQLSRAHPEKPQSRNPSSDAQTRSKPPWEDARDNRNRVHVNNNCSNKLTPQKPPSNLNAKFPVAPRSQRSTMPIKKCASQINTGVSDGAPAFLKGDGLDRRPSRALRTSKLPQPPAALERSSSAPSFPGAQTSAEKPDTSSGQNFQRMTRQDSIQHAKEAPSSNRRCHFTPRNAPSASPPRHSLARDRSSSQKLRSCMPVRSTTPRREPTPEPFWSSIRATEVPGPTIELFSGRSNLPLCSRSSTPDRVQVRVSANASAPCSRSNSPAAADKVESAIPGDQFSSLPRYEYENCSTPRWETAATPSHKYDDNNYQPRVSAIPFIRPSSLPRRAPHSDDCRDALPRFNPRRPQLSRHSSHPPTPRAEATARPSHKSDTHHDDNKSQPGISLTPAIRPSSLPRRAPHGDDCQNASPHFNPRGSQLLGQSPRRSTPRAEAAARPSHKPDTHHDDNKSQLGISATPAIRPSSLPRRAPHSDDCQNASPRFTPRRPQLSRHSSHPSTPRAEATARPSHKPDTHHDDNKSQPGISANPAIRPSSLPRRAPHGDDCQNASPRFTPRGSQLLGQSPGRSTPKVPAAVIPSHNMDARHGSKECQPDTSAVPSMRPSSLPRRALNRVDCRDACLTPRLQQLLGHSPQGSTPRAQSGVSRSPKPGARQTEDQWKSNEDSFNLKWFEEVLRPQSNCSPMVLDRLALRSLPRLAAHNTVAHEDISFIERIGKGSFGAVWRAYFEGREVAVKQCEVGDVDSKMLLEETRCLQSLRHPRLVSYLGCCNKDGNVLMLMEYMSGGSLHNLLFKKKECLEFKEKARMAYEIAEGLAYIHGLGVVHRDLKTANIVLDSQLSCKLCDFGLTLMLEQSHVTVQKLEGSPRYMAPEQFQPKARITEKCDIWQFGCVMLELFCLSTPFAHCKNLQQIVVELLVRKKPPSPPAEADMRVRVFVQAGLRMSPAARPAASAFKRALCGAWKEREAV